jgi:hypothetical protein
MVYSIEKRVDVGLLWFVFYRPCHGGLQRCGSLRLVQPTLIFWNNDSGAHQPNAGLTLFYQHLSARIAFAQRNLAIGTDDFDADFCFDGESTHAHLPPEMDFERAQGRA